jgi:hypothetical protein
MSRNENTPSLAQSGDSRIVRFHGYALLAAVAAGWLAPTHSGWLLGSLCSVAVLSLAFRYPVKLASAVWIYLGALILTLVLGPLLWGWVRDSGGTAARLAWTPPVQSAAWNAFCMATIGTALGAHISLRASQVRSKAPSLRLLRVDPRLALLLAASPALFLWITSGGALIRRDSYLFLSSGSIAALVSGVLVIPATAASGWLAARPGPMLIRVAGVACAAAYALLILGEASRRLALYPLALFLGMRLSGGALPKRPAAAFVAVAMSLLLLPLPLGLRSLPAHGISEYSQSVSDVYDPSIDGLKESIENVLFSYPLAGVVASQSTHAPDDLLGVSLDLRSGTAAGWYELAPTLRVNEFTPFSGLGELAWISPLLLFLYSAMVGTLLGGLDRISRRISLLSIAGPILSLLLAVTFIQYNLRSSARMLMLLLVVVISGSVHAAGRARSGNLRLEQPSAPTADA